ncbi:hypothetical protein M4H60_002417 [Listeria monocytogenes]|nr:hypothetical protein [Listeria monocytogenes]
MAKMLSMKDFNFSDIGTTFELDEVMPKFATEERLDDKGNLVLGMDKKPRKFNTGEIIGYKYSVTILNGQFRKKATQISVESIDCPITNEEILKQDTVRCTFDNLQVSMTGNPMYYKADKINLNKGLNK